MNKFNKRIAVIVGCAFMVGALVGCAADGTLTNITTGVSNINKSALDAAELTICKGYNLGIPPKRYARDKLFDAWIEICGARQARIEANQASQQ